MIRSPLVRISIRTKGDLELQQYEFEPENGIKNLKFFLCVFINGVSNIGGGSAEAHRHPIPKEQLLCNTSLPSSFSRNEAQGWEREQRRRRM